MNIIKLLLKTSELPFFNLFFRITAGINFINRCNN